MALSDAAMDASPIAQVGLIFSIMKLFDPTSVVRESEQATARNARGVPEGVRNIWNQVLSGQVLTDRQVEDIKDTASSSISGATKTQKAIEEQFKGIATGAGLRPNVAIPDIIGEWRDFAPGKRKAIGNEPKIVTEKAIGEASSATGSTDPDVLNDWLEKNGYVYE